MNIYLDKLHQKDEEYLYQFELENRAFFETQVPSRGEEYYQINHFHNVLCNLLQEQADQQSHFYLIKNEDDWIIGRINLIDINKELRSCHVGYRIGKRSIGQGIATKALGLVLKEAKKLGIAKIYAMTTENNIGSQKVLKSNGFVLLEREKDTNFVHYVWGRE